MSQYNSKDLAMLIGVLDYHVNLPKVGNGIRAVITLRELISKELPKIDGLFLDMVCAYGVRCTPTLKSALALQAASEGDNSDYGKLVVSTTTSLVTKYGKEGERWQKI